MMAAPASCRITAPAKVNLSLHVAGRRADGYHELQGLVAFSTAGDLLDLTLSGAGETHAACCSLTLAGPFRDVLREVDPDGEQNLVIKAARLYLRQRPETQWPSPRFTLTKNLPVSAGIGGGSSDAAAALCALQQLNPAPLSSETLDTIALELGADVPMCLTPQAQMVAGIGEIRKALRGFPPLPALLVNPLIGVSTPQVFKKRAAPPLDGPTTMPAPPPLDSAANLIEWLHTRRNDLQAPAIDIAPEIGEVLALIGKTHHCRLARMSGSGATCFGLYDSLEAAQTAANELTTAKPDWWHMATLLR